MKNPKSQIPNPKQTPNPEIQVADLGGSSNECYGWDQTGQPPMMLREGQGNGKPFDFEERTAQFGEAIIRFCKKIPRSPANDRLIGQLTGCGTSVGANYC